MLPENRSEAQERRFVRDDPKEEDHDQKWELRTPFEGLFRSFFEELGKNLARRDRLVRVEVPGKSTNEPLDQRRLKRG